MIKAWDIKAIGLTFYIRTQMVEFILMRNTTNSYKNNLLAKHFGNINSVEAINYNYNPTNLL